MCIEKVVPLVCELTFTLGLTEDLLVLKLLGLFQDSFSGKLGSYRDLRDRLDPLLASMEFKENSEPICGTPEDSNGMGNLIVWIRANISDLLWHSKAPRSFLERLDQLGHCVNPPLVDFHETADVIYLYALR
jgi:hypothetical protein